MKTTQTTELHQLLYKLLDVIYEANHEKYDFDDSETCVSYEDFAEGFVDEHNMTPSEQSEEAIFEDWTITKSRLMDDMCDIIDVVNNVEPLEIGDDGETMKEQVLSDLARGLMNDIPNLPDYIISYEEQQKEFTRKINAIQHLDREEVPF